MMSFRTKFFCFCLVILRDRVLAPLSQTFFQLSDQSYHPKLHPERHQHLSRLLQYTSTPQHSSPIVASPLNPSAYTSEPVVQSAVDLLHRPILPSCLDSHASLPACYRPPWVLCHLFNLLHHFLPYVRPMHSMYHTSVSQALSKYRHNPTDLL